LVFTTNRLFRKTYKALQFVEEEVVERGIRCLFIKSGVDSADEKRWRTLLHIHAMTDEFVVAMYADNVRAAHEGHFDKQIVCGTLSFGYVGQPIPGEFTKRKKPRCRVVIDREIAPWVMQIFQWYVIDQFSINHIVQNLNANPSIPLGPKSTSGQWTHQAVRGVLKNPRYRGWWEYGVTHNIWQSKKDYSRQVACPEPLRSAQFEELRIISDELWYQAQQRLAEVNRSAVGRKPRDGNRRARPKLLNGLFHCPEHDQALYVGGSHGQYMFCKTCKGLLAADRPLYSHLPRKLALRLTCEKLASLVQEDEELVAQVIAACQQEAKRAQQPELSQKEALCKRENQLNMQIQFVLNNAGETEADQREAGESLKKLRRQRGEVAAEISRKEKASVKEVTIPDELEVRAMLRNLSNMLSSAALETGDHEIGPAREIMVLLTGGRIDLFQQGEPKAQRGWLQGRFQVNLLPYLVQQTFGAASPTRDHNKEITIDYRETSALEKECEHAKKLYDHGYLNSQIAAALGCARNWVTKLLRFWFDSRGLTMPDGRSRRSSLSRKQVQPTMYQQIADQAKALWDEGLADVQIAERLLCSAPTVVAAVTHWHASRGLKMPNHNDRRAALVERMESLFRQGRMIKEIAREVGMCSRSVTLLLRHRFGSLGQAMPDGRTRRAALAQRQEMEDQRQNANNPSAKSLPL
jgi:hypothetical protein